MDRKLKYTATFILLSFCLQAFGGIRSVAIDFYSEKIEIEYQTEIILPGLLIAEDISLMEYYEQMNNTPYQSLLDSLAAYKSKYDLNDWLYYELLHAVINQIFDLEGSLKKGVTLWFLLTKSGYDTRLSYHEDEVFIYAWSEEDIFETPMIMDENRKFINLSSINSSKKGPEELKLLLYRPGQGGQPFSFKLDRLPQFKAQIESKEVHFKIKEQSFRITFKTDAILYEIMKNYPAVAERAYFDIPMSETAYNSLIPKLRFMTEDKSIPEALQILVSFTRTGFAYKDDQEVFGKSKPMAAEELFHYPFSDCEDRSALFYFLVKEILNLPMLIIAYPDHLSIAVASEEIEGQAFTFEGRQYYICDPTGPAGSNLIGVPPNGYENMPFEILGGYSQN